MQKSLDVGVFWSAYDTMSTLSSRYFFLLISTNLVSAENTGISDMQLNLSNAFLWSSRDDSSCMPLYVCWLLAQYVG
jgi:hypothetical protein